MNQDYAELHELVNQLTEMVTNIKDGVSILVEFSTDLQEKQKAKNEDINPDEIRADSAKLHEALVMLETSLEKLPAAPVMPVEPTTATESTDSEGNGDIANSGSSAEAPE